MLHTYLALLVLAATTLAIAGCGGSSKTHSSPTNSSTTALATTASVTAAEAVKIQAGTPLSHAAWIVKGDVICARTNEKLNSTTIRKVQEYAPALTQAASYDRAEATELSKLVPPAALASDWRQVVNGFQKFSEYTTMAAEYAERGEVNQTGPVFAAGKKVHEELAAIAKHDGFKHCSEL